MLFLSAGVVPAYQDGPQGKPAPGNDTHGDALPPGATRRLGTVRFRHEGGIFAVAVSPDGKAVASLSEDKSVRVWELATGKEQARSPALDWPADLAFVPESKKLAYCTETGVWLWDWAAGQKPELFVKADTYTVQVAPDYSLTNYYAVRKIAFSADGKHLSWADDRGKLRMRDLGTGKDWVCLEGQDWLQRLFSQDGARSVAFSPNGKLLAYAAPDNTVRLWSLANAREVLRLTGHQAEVDTLAFSPDGRVLATGSKDGTLRLWETMTGKERHRLEGHEWCYKVVFSANGQTLATGDGDGVVRVWSLPNYQFLRKVQGPSTGITSLALSPDGRTLIAVGEDEAVRSWEVATGKERGPAAAHRAKIVAAAFGPDGRTVATGSWDRTACVWDTATGNLLFRTPEHEGWMMAMALSPDGKQLATAGRNATIRLWDVGTGKPTALFKQPKDAVNLAFCQGGKTLAAYDESGLVSLLEAATGKLLFTVEVETAVAALVGSPGGNELAILHGEKVAVWDLTARKELWHKKQDGGYSGAVFSPNGKRLAVTRAGLYGAPTTEHIVEYEAATGAEVTHFGSGSGPRAESVAYVGEKWLACGRADGSILLWEVGGAKKPLEWQSKSGTVWALTGSPDGRSLVSGHANSTALLWAVPSGK
jgi:WD40 repeat protein